MKIIMGADPWGIKLKDAIKADLIQRDIEVEDIGSFEQEEKPYYVVASQVARAIQQKKADKGILICGTGMGVAIVANKFKGIYAAVVESEYAAFKCKQINNANVLAMGGMFVSEFYAVEAVRRWLDTGHTEGMEDELAEFLKGSLVEIEKIEDENFK